MKRYIPVITTLIALAFFIFGIFTGEVASMWRKAVSLCLSCIGIG